MKFLRVLKQSDGEVSPRSQLDKVLTYSGNSNPLSMSRSYSVRFACEFDLRMYPFDTQVCNFSSSFGT